jgi:hypothetical protein
MDFQKEAVGRIGEGWREEDDAEHETICKRKLAGGGVHRLEAAFLTKLDFEHRITVPDMQPPPPWGCRANQTNR